MPDKPLNSSPKVTVPLSAALRWLQKVEFPKKLGVCERLFAGELSKHGQCWVQTAAGLAWRLDLRNPTHRWIVYGYYEGSGFLRWAMKFLPEDGVVLDSGANIGQMALYLAQWLPRGRLFAFEPGTEASEWLAGCLSCHPTLPVLLSKIGLSDRDGTDSLANSRTEGTHGSQAAITTGPGETIQLARLDRFLASQGVNRVSLWKLDIEGHEIPALEGARALLEERRIQALYVELDGDNGKQIREFLGRFGYRCFGLDGSGGLVKEDTSIHHTNGLFLAA